MSQSMPAGPWRWHHWLACCVMVSVAAFSLWMRCAFPVYAIPESRYDDALFLHLAASILGGEWLGHFDNTVLVKGCLYPLFIAASFLAHIPLKTAEQAAYILASLAVASVIIQRGVTEARYSVLAVTIFVALCLNPVLWYSELARVIREGLYVSLAVAVTALSVMVSFPTRSGSGPTKAIVTGVLLGAASAAFSLTREEGPWLVPTVLTILAIAVTTNLARSDRSVISLLKSGLDPRNWLCPVPLALLCALAAFSVAILTVCFINKQQYGVFETTEVTSGYFKSAYGALSRIKAAAWQRYIVFPKDARDRAYAVSPAAAELAATVDGPMGIAWANGACATYGISPCTGVHAGWFQWVFREAVAQAGHYGSARSAKRYYERLASEINRACARRLLNCWPRRDTLAPPFRLTYLGDTMREAVPMTRLLLRMGGGEVGSPASIGFGPDIAAIEDLVGAVSPSGERMRIVRGSTTSLLAGPTVRDTSLGLSQFGMSVQTQPAPIGPDALPGVAHPRTFRLATTCPDTACELVMNLAGEKVSAAALQGLRAGPLGGAGGPASTIIVETTTREAHPQGSGLMAFQRRLAADIAGAYDAATAPALLMASVAAGVGFLARRHSRVSPALYGLCAGSLVAITSRVLLLSYLQVTSIPSRNVLYLAPASPFVIIFSCTGMFLGLDGLACLYRSRRRRLGSA